MKFVYVTYVGTTPEKLWEALTTADLIRQYWAGRINESRWTKGAPLESRSPDGELVWRGKILARKRPWRLVHTFEPLCHDEPPSRVTFDIERSIHANRRGGSAVKLTVTHDQLPEESEVYVLIREGWPMILSSLKSMLESGRVIRIAIED